MKKSNIIAVLDTNIFISAWFHESDNCDKILSLVRDRKIRMLFAQDTIGELIYCVKNFARHNIDDVSSRITLMKSVMELFYYSKSVNTTDTKAMKTNDVYDDMFVKCAIEGKADYLITDDLKSGMHEINHDNLTVITSEEFVHTYEKKYGEIEI
ncbi:putative toxin-antitoxin system toxin component, PIN family [Siminovitchia fordii]|uniref:PIN domain-containing protein n=1 Tax=Siminovitchia fordii TaxID=254759 RepID=A0ABQ4KDI1_9BACI|nr:putative toxin-antitoxin system toxin component, PIN family [Siminovitchia fordii]GIN23121.1 hypothetical protein J1TS3_42550 [Siminovitchia fordii]